MFVFEECDIMYLYTSFNFTTAKTVEVENFKENNLLKQRLIHKCIDTARIKIDYNYGDGYVFFTEDVLELLQYLEVNQEKMALSSANLVTVVTSKCSDRIILDVETILKAGWFQLFISHHIVMLIDCQVNT